MPPVADRAVFARTHRLDGGLRVRLRLARPGDQGPMSALLDRLGYAPSEGELLDLVRFDPHRRAVICATALVGGRERVLGFGAIDLEAPAAAATVVVDPDHACDVTRLLRRALAARRSARTAGIAGSASG